MLRIRKRRNDDMRLDAGETFDYEVKPTDPTERKLYRKPDWGWLDSLCGEGYHCVSYQLVNRK